MMDRGEDLELIATESARGLVESVARALGAALHLVHTERFANENLACRVPDLEATDRRLFLFQSFPSPVSDRVLELLFALRALAAAAPRRLTAVLPYLAYSRSDCAESPGEPVRARLLADAIEAAGAQRIVAFDLHSPQLAGFFRVPVVELSACSGLADAVRRWQLEDPVVVSPDLGGAKRASRFAMELGCPLAMVVKQRTASTVAVRALAGDVRGRSAVLFDDEIATGGTLIAAAELLLSRGARSVHAVATHGLFAADALERLERSPLQRILVTDSFPGSARSAKLETVSIAADLAAFLRGDAR